MPELYDKLNTLGELSTHRLKLVAVLWTFRELALRRNKSVKSSQVSRCIVHSRKNGTLSYGWRNPIENIAPRADLSRAGRVDERENNLALVHGAWNTLRSVNTPQTRAKYFPIRPSRSVNKYMIFPCPVPTLGPSFLVGYFSLRLFSQALNGSKIERRGDNGWLP